MKSKFFMAAIIAAGLMATNFSAFQVYGQESPEMSNRDKERTDSLQKVDMQVMEQQRADNKDALDNAKDASMESQAKAKEAQRVERDATVASRESKKALRMERNAQKARRNADRQTQKASDARVKSDSN
ncbi:MAG: hypothetical protein JW830_13090 [Bacteroidales bacterium]|nr:hypothetical protein [Bacteroidales bacterium]